MSLTVIMGGLGSGKTLLATLIAKNTRDRPVLSNYKLNLPNYQPLTPSMIPAQESSCLMLIDECYTWLESRTSGKDLNRYLSYVLFQSRKRRIDLVMTLQLLGSMDVRFRELADYYVVAERIPEGHIYWWYDRGRRTSTTFFLPIESAEKLYGLYDTLEIIKTPQDIGKELTLADPDDIDKAIADLIDKALDIAPLEQWDLGAVKAFIMQERYPYTYASKVFDQMKLMRVAQGVNRKIKTKKVEE